MTISGGVHWDVQVARRFEGVLTATQRCQRSSSRGRGTPPNPPSSNAARQSQRCQRSSSPNPARQSPMLPGASRSRRCPRLPGCQTTPVLLSVPLALHTLFSAPSGLQPELCFALRACLIVRPPISCFHCCQEPQPTIHDLMILRLIYCLL